MLGNRTSGVFTISAAPDANVGSVPIRLRAAGMVGGTFVTRDGQPELNGRTVQEAYLTWTVPDTSPALKGLSLKGGKFVTLLGAEVIEPWSNYNYSRSFLFSFAIRSRS